VNKIIIPVYKTGYPVGQYMSDAIAFIEQVVESFIAIYNPKISNTITLWVRGSSGAILAALFTSKMVTRANVNIRHVKK
jgi:hypothetical protein